MMKIYDKKIENIFSVVFLSMIFFMIFLSIVSADTDNPCLYREYYSQINKSCISTNGLFTEYEYSYNMNGSSASCYYNKTIYCENGCNNVTDSCQMVKNEEAAYSILLFGIAAFILIVIGMNLKRIL